MKLKRTDENRFRLHLSRRERAMLAGALHDSSPFPEDYHQLTHSATADGDPILPAAEEWRRESLQAHRTELAGFVAQFIGQLLPEPEQKTMSVELDEDQVESLLQALNEVRVGAWIRLGCPDPADPEPGEDPVANELTVRLHLAGMLETAILEALHGPAFGELPEHDPARC